MVYMIFINFLERDSEFNLNKNSHNLSNPNKSSISTLLSILII
jgi:hypothetical protein